MAISLSDLIRTFLRDRVLGMLMLVFLVAPHFYIWAETDRILPYNWAGIVARGLCLFLVAMLSMITLYHLIRGQKA